MYKRILFLFLFYFAIVIAPVNAQLADSATVPVTARDTAWKKGALITATFGQTYFTDNWAAGGEPSYSLNGRMNFFAHYELGKVLWQNKLDMAYGFTNQKISGFKKNDDIFELTSNLGYKLSEKWYASLMFSARSQFSEGIKYTDTDTTSISNFLSPLYLNIAPGMTFKASKSLQLFITPVNARFVYVQDTVFADLNSIEPGKHWRNEFGFLFKANFKKQLTETVDVLSNLDVFYDYLDPKAPAVSWEVLVNVKIWKALSLNLNTFLIYDENVREEVSPGEFNSVGVQFKEVFGAGLAVNF